MHQYKTMTFMSCESIALILTEEIPFLRFSSETMAYFASHYYTLSMNHRMVKQINLWLWLLEKYRIFYSYKIYGGKINPLMVQKVFPIDEIELLNLEKLDFKAENLRPSEYGKKFTYSIPAEIAILQNLKHLSFRRMQIKYVKEGLSQLSKLEYLDLSENNISIIPKSIFKLQNLIYLNISYNQLCKLHDDIVNLTELQYLNISHNSFLKLSDVQYAWIRSLQYNNDCEVVISEYNRQNNDGGIGFEEMILC